MLNRVQASGQSLQPLLPFALGAASPAGMHADITGRLPEGLSSIHARVWPSSSHSLSNGPLIRRAASHSFPCAGGSRSDEEVSSDHSTTRSGKTSRKASSNTHVEASYALRLQPGGMRSAAPPARICQLHCRKGARAEGVQACTIACSTTALLTGSARNLLFEAQCYSAK